MLIEGDTALTIPRDEKEWPKTFFEVLVRTDWRKWVEAVKREVEAWNDNNAVTIVPIVDVPLTAKTVPLGELYSIKRDSTYKFRQYIMGNLLRAGIDYDNNFQQRYLQRELLFSFQLGQLAESKLVVGMQWQDTYKPKNNLISMHSYPVTPNILVWIMMKLQS